jgi:ABC-2 type transport system permease protein
MTDATAGRPGIGATGRSASALLALFGLTLRQNRHGKRWLVMALLMLMPLALAIVVRCTSRNVPGVGMEFMFVFMLIPQALLPLVALIYASGMINDEQEEQTITYLLIRPIAKWSMYVVKLLATVMVAVALTIVFTSLTYVAIYWGTGDGGMVLRRCAMACGVHSLAVVAYCCIFGLMSLLTRKILVLGVLYVAIVEGLFANLAFGIRLVTVIYYARILAYRMMPFVVKTPYGYDNFAADAWQLDVANDPKLLEHPSGFICLLVLLGGSAVCVLLAAIICMQREFYVKTAEKA